MACFIVIAIFRPGINWYFLPIFIFSFLNFEITKLENLKNKNINLMSITQITSRLSSNFLKLVPGPPFYLILSEILGSFIGILTAKKASIKEIFKIQKPDWKVLKAYHKYPLFYSFNLGSQILCLEAPSILFGLSSNNFMIGIYGISQRLLIQPITIISNNLFASLFSVKMSKEEKKKKTIQIALVCVMSGIILKLGFDFIGSKLLINYLGSKWVEGTTVFSLFSFLLITKSLTSLTLANYVAHYTLERSLGIKALQIICIGCAYLYFGQENPIIFLKSYIVIDMFFDVLNFIVSFGVITEKKFVAKS